MPHKKPTQGKSVLPKGKGAEKYEGAKFIKPMMKPMMPKKEMNKRMKAMPSKRHHA